MSSWNVINGKAAAYTVQKKANTQFNVHRCTFAAQYNWYRVLNPSISSSCRTRLLHLITVTCRTLLVNRLFSKYCSLLLTPASISSSSSSAQSRRSTASKSASIVCILNEFHEIFNVGTSPCLSRNCRCVTPSWHMTSASSTYLSQLCTNGKTKSDERLANVNRLNVTTFPYRWRNVLS